MQRITETSRVMELRPRFHPRLMDNRVIDMIIRSITQNPGTCPVRHDEELDLSPTGEEDLVICIEPGCHWLYKFDPSEMNVYIVNREGPYCKACSHDVPNKILSG